MQAAVTDRSERGASLVEYVLLAAFVALAALAAMTFFGGEVGQRYSRTGSSVVEAGPD